VNWSHFIEQMAAEMPDIAPAMMAGVLAMAHVEGDRNDDARRLLDEFAAADFDLPLDQTWLTAMTDYAEAAIECRDPQYAGPLFDRLSPWADQWSTVGSTAEGPVSHFLAGLSAVLGRYDQADAYFAQSAAVTDRVCAKFFAARTDLLWGQMLAERQAQGDIEKARDLLSKARTFAAANGYGNVERRRAGTRTAGRLASDRVSPDCHAHRQAPELRVQVCSQRCR
jgi:tetratricopeptide (TPR) repeat protein